ncbi:hypothetical protein ACS0TY_003105 [Phlomoides rotata]
MATPSSFFLSLILSLMIHFSASINTSDQSTLLIIKNHLLTTNPHNFLSKNWSTTTSICSWIGVTCYSRQHRVTSLNISNMGLSATVPSQLGNLSFLDSLYMNNNNFHGNLPHELSRLQRLSVINLKNNNLTGFIPPSFFNISKLERLILSSNLLEGSISPQIGNLTNLKAFVATDNRFSEAIPSEIGSLKMLEFLYLGQNRFEGEIPQEMSNLYSLKIMDLNTNRLSGSLPAGIFNISSLENIYVTSNNLSGSLPSTMGNNLPNLKQLFLNYNSLTGNIPESISNSSKLITISMHSNEFGGPIPVSFGNLKSLDCLHLYENNLSNGASDQELSFITSLTNCPKLRDVAVNNNPLDGFLPTSIGNLSTSLRRFYASSCKIKGQLPDEVGNLSHIVNLHLGNNEFSGFFPNSFRGLQSIQGLWLWNNKIRGSFPTSLCGLPALSTLDLSHNQISGPIPDCIGSVTSLRKVRLDSNRLTSRIPSTLWNLKDVLILDLSSNSFSGNLPQQVENLKVATDINLSRNEFTGLIPAAYGSMQNLINFSLGSNKLQGSIPESFGRMISLERLDLSDNDLSGEIPKTLQSLKSLKYFNVSFNRLRGEIPPFNNSTSQFYESNEALCGDPRLNVQLCRSTSSNKKKLIVVLSVMIGSLILMTIFVVSWIMRRRRKEASSESDPEFQSSIGERFSHRQIQQGTDGFSQANLLGSGSFGSVYRASFEKGVVVAVKVFNLELEYAGKSFKTECEMLSNLRHRNLTKVISACSNLDFKALILEYMHKGSLEQWLYSDGYFLDIMQRIDIMIDVASALEYLHHGYHKPVIHCDLKPSNILLDRDMVGRVTDFGITKLLGEDQSIVHTQTLATIGYMAPEYGREGLVSSACDVYSYGIVLMETFTGRRPSDDMFGGESSLRSWVSASLPDSMDGVVDSKLMRDEESHFNEKMECVSKVMGLAMNCTVDAPRERMKMKDVLISLKKIKLHYTAILG